jgi:hypothetical protein
MIVYYILLIQLLNLFYLIKYGKIKTKFDDFVNYFGLFIFSSCFLTF